jgi:hypothetical protein
VNRAKGKARKPGRLDKDSEIVVAVLRALATVPHGETAALRQRLGEAIIASLLETMRARDLPTDGEMARRAIVAAVCKGVLRAINQGAMLSPRQSVNPGDSRR